MQIKPRLFFGAIEHESKAKLTDLQEQALSSVMIGNPNEKDHYTILTGTDCIPSQISHALWERLSFNEDVEVIFGKRDPASGEHATLTLTSSKIREKKPNFWNIAFGDLVSSMYWVLTLDFSAFQAQCHQHMSSIDQLLAREVARQAPKTGSTTKYLH